MIKQIDGGPMGGLISGFSDVYISKVEGDDIWNCYVDDTYVKENVMKQILFLMC